MFYNDLESDDKLTVFKHRMSEISRLLLDIDLGKYSQYSQQALAQLVRDQLKPDARSTGLIVNQLKKEQKRVRNKSIQSFRSTT